MASDDGASAAAVAVLPEVADAGTGTVAEVALRLDVAEGVAVAFADALEVALDCYQCGRTARTVVFPEVGAEGRCTPTGHPFPGRLVGKRAGAASGEQGSGAASVTYRLEYDYRPFDDRARAVPSVAHPTWARVALAVTCPSCGRVAQSSVQNNAVRPLRFSCPRCDCRLYHECEEMPVFRLFGADGEVVREQTVSDLGVYVPAEAARSLAPEAVKEIARVAADTPGGVRRKLDAGQPVYYEQSFRVRNPVVAQAMLAGVLAALSRAGAEFAVLSSGRDVTETMRRRHLSGDD